MNRFAAQFSRLRLSVILLLFFTGACGLIYEVIWQRYLANFIGSEAKASALVLAVFLGGLALGYDLFGRMSQRRSARGLVQLTGALEVGIGLWAVAFPWLCSVLWQHMEFWAAAGIFGDLLIAGLLTLVPTVLMGGTLPLLTKALSRDLNEAGRVHSWVYSSNTAGAFLGCLIGGFFLMPQFGLSLAVIYTSFVSLTAGVLLLLLAPLYDATIPVPEATPVESHRSDQARKRLPFHVMAFTCGFVSIAMQTALIRTIGLTMGSSEYAFAMVVAIFVCLLAYGAYSVSGFNGQYRRALWINQMFAAVGIGLIYFSIPYWPYCVHVVRVLLTSVPLNFYVYHAVLFVAISLVVGIAVRAMGRTMPLLFAASSERFEDVGSDVGSLYFTNTVGCVAGALLGGFLAYYIFDLDHMFKISLILILATALPACIWWSEAHRRNLAIVTSGCLLVAFALPRWSWDGFKLGVFRQRQPVASTFLGPEALYKETSLGGTIDYRRDGPTSTMEVLSIGRWGEPDYSRSIVVNGKSDGSTAGVDQATVKMLAHVPALLSGAPLKRVATIGFGTGITAGALGLYPETQEVHIFEISPLVDEYAPLFDFANHGVSKDPKMHWHIGDAFQQMSADQTKYSVIVSEPSNPWVIGVERLYSAEFLKLAASRLETGGVYAQWFHNYDVSEATIGMVVHTFGSAFHDVRLFFTNHSDFLIIGTNDGDWNHRLGALDERWQNDTEVRRDLALSDIPSVENLFAHELIIPKEYFAHAGLHTLEVPKLAYQAGYEFFLGMGSDLIALSYEARLGAWQRYVSDHALIALWGQLHPGADVNNRYAEALCGPLNAVESLDVKSVRCQRAYMQLSMSNREFQKKLSPTQLHVLSLFSPNVVGRNPASVDSPKEARIALKELLIMDSPATRVRKEFVEELSKPCFKELHTQASIACRLQMVADLAAIGETDASSAAMVDLRPVLGEIPASAKTEVFDVITSSVRAREEFSPAVR